MLLLKLLERGVSARLIQAAYHTWSHLVTHTLVHELPSLLLRVAHGATVRVQTLLAYSEVAFAFLKLCQFSVLICNVDIMLHVLVLERELALAGKVARLHLLGQIERDELVRLDLLRIALARALYRDDSATLSPLLELHSLVWSGLRHEAKSLTAQIGINHRLLIVLSQRY